jgi:hypothetical protein
MAMRPGFGRELDVLGNNTTAKPLERSRQLQAEQLYLGQDGAVLCLTVGAAVVGWTDISLPCCRTIRSG